MTTGDQKIDDLQSSKASVQKAKQDKTSRLSKALRDNLQRRKKQKRARKLAAAANMADQSKKDRI